MKISKLILPAVCAVAMVSCGEEESPLLFKYDNLHPNVSVDYYSVDPSCVEAEYHITANALASEVKMSCTNSSSITVTPSKPYVNEEWSDEKKELANGGYTATVENGNVLVIKFQDVVGKFAEDEHQIITTLQVEGMVKGELRHTTVTIWRALNYTEVITGRRD